MYQNVERTCRAIVLLIKAFFFTLSLPSRLWLLKLIIRLGRVVHEVVNIQRDARDPVRYVLGFPFGYHCLYIQ